MIQIEKLRREFDDLVAVNDLELSVPEGEIYGLIGPNGAGKTTTIRMSCGLLTPTDGRVSIAGVDVHNAPERAQQFIGYLSDFFSVHEDLKVWEYLDYFARAYKMPEPEIPARIEEVIAQVNLEVKRDAMIKDATKLYVDDFAYIPLHQQAVVWAARKNIDLVQLADNSFPLRFVTVK